MLKMNLADILNLEDQKLAEALYRYIEEKGRAKFEELIKSELIPNTKLLTPSLIYLLMVMSQKNLLSEQGRRGARGKDKKSGAEEKRKGICQIWASGQYTSRDICAEQECAALNMSFSAARKALRNTPDPNR